MAKQSKRLEFTGATGEKLAARLEHPPGPARGHALFAHCFTCSKDLKAVVRITRALVEQGIAVFRFDFTGLGESAGDFADTDFSSNLEDLLAAADFMRLEHAAPDLLIGHSLGGAAVLAVASRVPECRAVATIGAPADTAHLKKTLERAAPGLESALAERPVVEIELAGRPIRVRRRLLDDLAEHQLEAAIAALGRPLLVFHSPVDRVVASDHARRIYQAARHPKSFVSLDGADHLLLERPADSAFVGRVLAAWAERYLGESPEAAAEPRLEGGLVEVTGGASGYRNRVRAGRHAFLADEPESVGGADSGPTPYDLLLAALGACKSMTLRMYADRKGWPLAGTRVTLAHGRVHAKDCEDCVSTEGKVDEIRVELEVAGPLDAEQRARLLEIADRCPVHRTLSTETRIRSRLAG